MKVLDLFSGTHSIAREFEKRGHEVFTIDNNKRFAEETSWTVDIMKVTAQDILERFGRPQVIWASPPCEKFSIAGVRFHWEKVDDIFIARHDHAVKAIELVYHTRRLIEQLKPDVFFIENPRGMLRKFSVLQDIARHTVTYCQFEKDKPPNERRMKPTDIWTSHPDPQFPPMCKNGDPCHESSPRSSNKGTMKNRSYIERSKIPAGLGQHVAKMSEAYLKDKSAFKPVLRDDHNLKNFRQTSIFEYIDAEQRA